MCSTPNDFSIKLLSESLFLKPELSLKSDINMTFFKCRDFIQSLNDLSDSESYEQAFNILINNYFIIPEYNQLENQRITKQKGAFLLSGYYSDGITFTQKLTDEPDLDLKPLINEFQFEIIILSQLKKGIIEQLDEIGINESSLFPELEHQMSYIFYKYNISKNIKESFQMIMTPKSYEENEERKKEELKIRKEQEERYLPILEKEFEDQKFLQLVKQKFDRHNHSYWYDMSFIVNILNSEIKELFESIGYSAENSQLKAEAIIQEVVATLKKS